MEKEEITENQNVQPENENIDKIRDILFGNNISEIDKRFNKLEQELQEMISDLRDDVQKKLHSFDDYFKSEISLVLDQLKSEQKTRNEAVANVNRELVKVNNAIDETNEQLKDNVRDVRNKMMDHYKENSENISRVDRDLKKQMSREVNQLTDNKVDRKALAVMLSDIALRLSESPE